MAGRVNHFQLSPSQIDDLPVLNGSGRLFPRNFVRYFNLKEFLKRGK